MKVSDFKSKAKSDLEEKNRAFISVLTGVWVVAFELDMNLRDATIYLYDKAILKKLTCYYQSRTKKMMRSLQEDIFINQSDDSKTAFILQSCANSTIEQLLNGVMDTFLSDAQNYGYRSGVFGFLSEKLGWNRDCFFAFLEELGFSLNSIDRNVKYVISHDPFTPVHDRPYSEYIAETMQKEIDDLKAQLIAIRPQAEVKPIEVLALPSPQYSTPYMDCIQEVVKEFWLNYDPESSKAPPKKNTVLEWLRENGHRWQLNGDSICRAIDTIARHPVASKGGVKASRALPKK